MSSEDRITVENVVDNAIVTGFKNVTTLYMESLEQGLKRNVIINEAGDAQALLQEMIEQTEGSATQQQSVEQLADLDRKMSRILGRD